MASSPVDCNTGEQRQMVFEEITLAGVPLRIEHASLPIDKVHFDPENPRLKYLKEQHPEKTDEELLFLHSDTPWLKKDIAEKGVLDQIYVRADGKGGYLAVEGNRRTAVVKKLASEHPDDPRFCFIPARIMPSNTSKEQEALLMASFHVAGKLKWDAQEKAGHVYHMLQVLGLPIEELSTTLHMAGPTIKRTSRSYELLEHYKRIDGQKYADDAGRKWSFFNEMLKIKEFRNRDLKGPEWADQYCRWVGEGRLPNATDVRTLEKILKSSKARNLFENEDTDVAFAKAAKEVDRVNPGRNSKFFAQLEKVTALGKAATLDDMTMARDNEAARDTVVEAHQTLLAFMEQSGVRAPGTPRRVA